MQLPQDNHTKKYEHATNENATTPPQQYHCDHNLSTKPRATSTNGFYITPTGFYTEFLDVQ